MPPFRARAGRPTRTRPSSWELKRRRRPLRLEELESHTTPSVTVVPQQFTTNQYTALSITQSQLLAGDTGGTDLQVSDPTQPAHATLANNNNGTFTFTPDSAFTGSNTFQYTVNGPATTLAASAAGFGSSAVSISGDTAIVGESNANVSGKFAQGAAYVFVRSGNTWNQQAVLTAPDGAAIDGFGFSVSIDGDTAAIGTYGQTQKVYVFARSDGMWSQQAELVAADGTASDLFGRSVALSGNTIVVGAEGKPVAGHQLTGVAYVFVRSGGVWSQQAELSSADNNLPNNDNGLASSRFGSVVSLSGDTAVIGGYFQAAAYVFVRSGGAWSQQAKLADPAADISGYFGNAVAVSGDTAVIGEPGAVTAAAYVFVRSGGTWNQQAELTNPADIGFGQTVAIDGDMAIIGSQVHPVFAFVRSGGAWSQLAELAAPDGSDIGNGTSNVAISAGTAVVGTGIGANLSLEAYAQDLGTAATATVQVNPATAQLFVSPAALPDGTEGELYPSAVFKATGGAGSGYTFQQSGILPAGITFDAATGQLVGTPAQVGTFPGIVIAANDGQGGSGSQTYTLIINHYGLNGFPVPYPLTVYAPPTSETDPNADLEAYIRGLYHSVLDRDAEVGATSLPFWENVFNIVQTGTQTDPLNLNVPAGTNPFQYVVDGIWQSQEHRWDEVETYYQDLLGRTLDLTNDNNVAEGQYWVNQFVFAGATEEIVIRGFLSSPEYLFNHRTDASLANSLNTNLLSGIATSADLQTWAAALSALDAQRAAIQNQTFASPEAYAAQISSNLGALDDETTQTGVLFEMLGSAEYQQGVLNSFYQAFLRRAGTAAEIHTLLSQTGANGKSISLGTIAELMVASPEYRTNAVNGEV